MEDVELPELGPGEALVAVMASAINYNTVWTSIFEPMATFGFLERWAYLSLAAKHDRPYHVVASDLAGVVLATGPGVHSWKPGTRSSRTARWSWKPRRPQRHDARPRAADLGLRDQLRRARRGGPGQVHQLMPKPRPPHLGGGGQPGLVNSTAYRQLVSRNGAGMKQGDNVLIWGASGGLGGYATQFALNGGATPICVVSPPRTRRTSAARWARS